MIKKGQAATEFLTTYGWALLLIGVGVAGVWYFAAGTDVSVPNQCTFSDPFVCNDIKVTPNNVQLDLTANGIQDGATVNILINGIPYNGGDCANTLDPNTDLYDPTNNPYGWSNYRKTLTCTPSGSGASEGELFSGSVTINNYQLTGGSVSHNSVYTISGTVET